MSNIHFLDSVANNGGNQPSMRAIAEAFGVTTNTLYSRGKKPIAGQVYDPEATNWDAISEYLNTKVPEGENMDTMVAKAIEIDKEYQVNVRSRSASGNNLIEVDGVMIAKRKAAMFEMGSDQESFLCFKDDGNVYKMVYQTESHTVIRPVDETGEFASNELRVLSNGTINTKCIAPVRLQEAIEYRFSGKYAEDHKVEETEKEAEETAAE